jgi:integrase
MQAVTPVGVEARWSAELSAIYELQRRHALRISEVLRLSVGDLNDDQTIFVAASKGSADRTLDDAELWDALDELARGQTSGDIFTLSYSQIYRAYDRAGVDVRGPSESRRRVTHALRTLRIQELRDDGHSVEEIADEIGHKDPDSTRHYLEPDVT